jgi:CrcB protein
LVLVASGGAVGSVLRYAVTGIAQRLFASGGSAAASFPVGTLVVNVTGSFLIGLLMGLAESRAVFGAEARLLLVTGLLGGYTTFSAFSLETLVLFRAGQMGTAIGSVLLQVLLGLAAAFAGFTAGMTARP